jgi:HEAT repeat protein
VRGILSLLGQLGRSSQEQGAQPEPGAFQQRLSTLPSRSQFTLQQALAGLAAQAPTQSADQPMLLKLAEHVAIRFALDSYERGEVKVDAVREMLDSMGKEIDGLRTILGAHEEKLSRAGVDYKSHVDQLAQKFWAEVPQEGKLATLMSADAWCVPPNNTRQFIDDLLNRGDEKTANEILLHYASCISQPSGEARRATAMGLAELADLFSSGDAQQLVGAIKDVGVQLCAEEDPELQTLVSAGFVRLVQEAGTQRCYPAMLQALESLEAIVAQRPTIGPGLRPRIGIEDRLPEFLEEALRSELIHPGLAELMSKMPLAAADQVSSRFSRSGFRDDCDLLIQAAALLGEVGLAHLRETFRTAPPAQAVDMVGLLSRLDIHTLQEWLPARMKDWQRTYHDRVVRQLAAGGAKERCLLLLGVFDVLDPLVKPLAIDEIGMSGDASTIPFLRTLLQREVKEGSGAYLRLKAIEALGRLSDVEIVPALRKILETRQLFRWTYPAELRVVAAQVVAKLGPDWWRTFQSKSGLDAAELAMALPDTEPMSHCIRQRRYPRLKLSRPLPALATSDRDELRMDVQVMNLGGGVASCDRYLTPGTLVAIKFGSGMRAVRGQAFVRDARSQNMGFEIVDMDLEERYRLRKMLVELGGAPVPASAKSRSRRRGRPTAAPKRPKAEPSPS